MYDSKYSRSFEVVIIIGSCSGARFKFKIFKLFSANVSTSFPFSFCFNTESEPVKSPSLFVLSANLAALFFARPKSIPYVLIFFLYSLSATATVVPHAVVAIDPASGALIVTAKPVPEFSYKEEGQS